MSMTCEEVFRRMEERFVAAEAGDWETRIQFLVEGEGGGDWIVEIAGGACRVASGKADEPAATVTTSAETWVGCATGDVNPQMAFMTGKIKISGNMADVLKMQNPKIFPRQDD